MITALIQLDAASAPGGAIRATDTGWEWHLIAAVRDTVSGRKEILAGYSGFTLDADGLVATRDKLIAATKAAAITAGFTTLDAAVITTFQLVNPVP
jgi:hypothetical protein